MTVFLGTFGQVELQREFGDVDLRSTINPSDVNATEKRFSFDFEHGQLLTGDQIEITSTDASVLDFISSYTDSSVKKFINVDELDGIRLYDTFANALNGGTANATALATPADDIPVRVKVANAQARVLASVKSYELSNQRDTVDTTALSDEFKSRVSTLMSGSGRMTCEWQYTGSTTEELGNYLLELQLRRLERELGVARSIPHDGLAGPVQREVNVAVDEAWRDEPSRAVDDGRTGRYSRAPAWTDGGDPVPGQHDGPFLQRRSAVAVDNRGADDREVVLSHECRRSSR